MSVPNHLIFLIRKRNQTPFNSQNKIYTYEKNDMLRPHVDDVNFWNHWVVGLSMGSDIVMDFTNMSTKEEHPIFIPARSVYILTGDARYSYLHGIKSQKFNNHKRVSITFRSISDKFLSDSSRQQLID